MIRRASSRRFSLEEIRALTENPEYYDEETMGGPMPNPESDDDVLKSEQEFGLYVDADTPESEEIDLQKEIDKAEKARRRRRD